MLWHHESTITTASACPVTKEATSSEHSQRTTAALHRLAAIDDHGVSDYEGGRIRTQPENGRSDLVWCSHSSDRFLRNHRLSSFWGAPAESLHHRRVDDSRAHRVDADV